MRTFVEDGEPVTRRGRQDTSAIGWFHFRPREGTRPDAPELGYRLVSTAWGKGNATEGARALIDKGLEAPGISRVVAETMAVHTASWRVMEKAGMRHTLAFATEWPVRLPGDEYGEVEYSTSRFGWEASRTSS